MKRRHFLAEIVDAGGSRLDSLETYAMNSAIRASESLVRGIARGEGQTYSGEQPRRAGQVYTRQWVGDRTGRQVRAIVSELLP